MFIFVSTIFLYVGVCFCLVVVVGVEVFGEQVYRVVRRFGCSGGVYLFYITRYSYPQLYRDDYEFPRNCCYYVYHLDCEKILDFYEYYSIIYMCFRDVLENTSEPWYVMVNVDDKELLLAITCVLNRLGCDYILDLLIGGKPLIYKDLYYILSGITKLSNRLLKLLDYICSISDRVSIEDIMKYMGWSRRSTIERLRLLRNLKLIDIVEHGVKCNNYSRAVLGTPLIKASISVMEIEPGGRRAFRQKYLGAKPKRS